MCPCKQYSSNNDVTVETYIPEEKSKHGRINDFLIDEVLKNGLRILILRENGKSQSQNSIEFGILVCRMEKECAMNP